MNDWKNTLRGQILNAGDPIKAWDETMEKLITGEVGAQVSVTTFYHQQFSIECPTKEAIGAVEEWIGRMPGLSVQEGESQWDDEVGFGYVYVTIGDAQ